MQTERGRGVQTLLQNCAQKGAMHSGFATFMYVIYWRERKSFGIPSEGNRRLQTEDWKYVTSSYDKLDPVSKERAKQSLLRWRTGSECQMEVIAKHLHEIKISRDFSDVHTWIFSSSLSFREAARMYPLIQGQPFTLFFRNFSEADTAKNRFPTIFFRKRWDILHWVEHENNYTHTDTS